MEAQINVKVYPRKCSCEGDLKYHLVHFLAKFCWRVSKEHLCNANMDQEDETKRTGVLYSSYESSCCTDEELECALKLFICPES